MQDLVGSRAQEPSCPSRNESQVFEVQDQVRSHCAGFNKTWLLSARERGKSKPANTIKADPY